MVGTIDDVLQFVETIRLGGGPILSPQSARAMVTNAIGDIAVPIKGWGFGLATAVLRSSSPTRTPLTPGSWQLGGAYGHNWFVDPSRRLTAILLTNTALEGMNGQVGNSIRDAIFAEDYLC